MSCAEALNETRQTWDTSNAISRSVLLYLKEENFLKSETYTHKARQSECDVYLIRYTGPAGNADELYVKFSFNGWVVVHSFHLQR